MCALTNSAALLPQESVLLRPRMRPSAVRTADAVVAEGAGFKARRVHRNSSWHVLARCRALDGEHRHGSAPSLGGPNVPQSPPPVSSAHLASRPACRTTRGGDQRLGPCAGGESPVASLRGRRPAPSGPRRAVLAPPDERRGRSQAALRERRLRRRRSAGGGRTLGFGRCRAWAGRWDVLAAASPQRPRLSVLGWF